MSTLLLSPTPQRMTNRLLAALSQEEYTGLMSAAECVRMSKGSALLEAGTHVRYAYFPLSGMASMLSLTEAGRSVEVAAVGREGMVGIPAVLGGGHAPYQVTVQLAGTAVRIKAGALRSAFKRGGRFSEVLLRHTLGLLTQITQSAACNRFHSVDKRLARWLLVTRDRADADAFNLTQEALSYMLGVPRTSVTAFAASMQRDGLISYSRGHIVILDVGRLKATSCECYGLIRRELDDLLAA